MPKSHVRAKFRCLELHEKANWRGTNVHVRLMPVNAKHYDFRDGRTWESEHPENKKFWSASPSGECTMEFPSKAAAEAAGFVIGAYYYVDLHDPSVSTPGGLRAKTESLHFYSGQQVDITIAGPNETRLKIGVQNPGAIPLLIDGFLEAHAWNREQFGLHEWNYEQREDLWTLVFTRVEITEKEGS